MPFKKTVVAAALAAALLPGWALARADDAALEALIEEALARNPELVAVRQSVAAAQARPAQAGSRPGPMLSVMYQNDGARPSLGQREMTMLSFGASQEIPYPGKRGLRRQVAEADAGLVALELERARLGLVAAVKSTHYAVRLARGLASVAEEQRNLWREVQETAHVRYASAVGPQQELLRAQVESTRAQALHAQHHAEGRARLSELNRLLGRPVDTPLATPPLAGLEREGRAREELLAFSEATSPELRAAVAVVQREELALALARKDFKPDFAVQGAYVNRGELDPMWQAGLSVSLPSRGRARAARTEAEARLAASKARVDDVRLRLRSAVEQRLALLEAAEQIEATYREGLLVQGQVAVDSALALYRAGRGAQLTVLEPMVALLEDRTDYLRLLAAHATGRARLDEVRLEGDSGLEGLLMHGRTGFGAGMGSGGRSMAPLGVGSKSASSEMR